MRVCPEKFAFSVLLVLSLLNPPVQATDYKLYYLGGQSNMDGFGYVRDLKRPDAEPVKGVMIFHGNQGLDKNTVLDGRGLWTELKPGNGTGFKSDGTTNTLSDRFGVELSFGRRMQELDPDSHIAIIKSAGYLDLGRKFAEAVPAGNAVRN